MESEAPQTDFIAFDLETTGLSARLDRIVEIGAVRFTARGDVIDQFEQLVNPECRMPAAAQAVHGISDADLDSAPSAQYVLPVFLRFLGNAAKTVLVAHNASFDAGFLGRELCRAGHRLPDHRIYDTLALARRRHPELRHHRLESLADHFALERGRLHRALGDSLLVKGLWLRLGGHCASAEMLVSYPIHDPQGTAIGPHGWEALDRAIACGATVRIEYEGGTRGSSSRPITPLRFLQKGGETYVVAFCHLDSLEKSFRLDRIRVCTSAPSSGPAKGLRSQTDQNECAV
jgi:DNA polymerase III epsilon subunit family exonuclease